MWKEFAWCDHLTMDGVLIGNRGYVVTEKQRVLIVPDTQSGTINLMCSDCFKRWADGILGQPRANNGTLHNVGLPDSCV